MTVTIILTLTMCVLLFLMIWAAAYFYPWEGLLTFFPEDIAEKARLHQPPFPAAPVLGWISMALCGLGMVGVLVLGGWDGVRNGFRFGQLLVRFLVIALLSPFIFNSIKNKKRAEVCADPHSRMGLYSTIRCECQGQTRKPAEKQDIGKNSLISAVTEHAVRKTGPVSLFWVPFLWRNTGTG